MTLQSLNNLTGILAASFRPAAYWARRGSKSDGTVNKLAHRARGDDIILLRSYRLTVDDAIFIAGTI